MMAYKKRSRGLMSWRGDVPIGACGVGMADSKCEKKGGRRKIGPGAVLRQSVQQLAAPCIASVRRRLRSSGSAVPPGGAAAQLARTVRGPWIAAAQGPGL